MRRLFIKVKRRKWVSVQVCDKVALEASAAAPGGALSVPLGGVVQLAVQWLKVGG